MNIIKFTERKPKNGPLRVHATGHSIANAERQKHVARSPPFARLGKPGVFAMYVLHQGLQGMPV